METASHRVLSVASFLPKELYCQIFSHLSCFEITHTVSVVCSLWSNMTKQEFLWENLACRRYPDCRSMKKASWLQFYRSLTHYMQRGALFLHKWRKADYLYSASDRDLCIRRISLKAAKQQDLGFPIEHSHTVVHTDHLLPITALAIQAFRGCAYFFTGSMDATVKIWEGLKCCWTLHHHRTPVTALQADTYTLVSGSEDGEIVVWQKGKEGYIPLSAPGHDSAITDLQFGYAHINENRNVLYSASQDYTVCMWAMHFESSLECLKVIHFDRGYDLNACNFYLQNLQRAVSANTLSFRSESFEAFTELKRFGLKSKTCCCLSNLENGQFNLLISSEDRLSIKSFQLKNGGHQFILENEIQLKQPALKIFHSNEVSIYEPIVYVYHQDQTVSIHYRSFYSNSFAFVEQLNCKF